ncbi:hypothetical protein [Tepidiphilus succinatimandens]|uniref:hypothetical protein n=1 Tax=Tepidiphilus succinatimandens TaxID=224436 RepID=UPI00112F7DDE|nr:hypothetical protein [Tepidiphilus succinatimandens]
MPTRFEAYRMRDGVTPLAEDYFNPILSDIDARIAALEDRRADLESAIASLQGFGLERIDAVMQSPLAQLNAAIADALALRDALQAAVGNVFDLATKTQLQAAEQRASDQTEAIAALSAAVIAMQRLLLGTHYL